MQVQTSERNAGQRPKQICANPAQKRGCVPLSRQQYEKILVFQKLMLRSQVALACLQREEAFAWPVMGLGLRKQPPLLERAGIYRI